MKHFAHFPYKRVSEEEIAAVANELLQSLEQSDSFEKVQEQILAWDKHMKTWEGYAMLAQVHFTQDTNNPDFIAEREYYDNLQPVLQTEDQKIQKFLLQSPYKAQFGEAFGDNLIRSWDINLQAFDPKITEEKREESALSAEYSKILAQLKIPFQGKEYTLSSLTAFFESSDRTVREEARTAQSKALESVGTELDRIYDKLVHLRHKMALKMGFSSYIDMGYAEMGRIDYNQHDVQVFRDQVQEVIVPLAQQIIEQRKQRLDLSDYAFHDEELSDKLGDIHPKGDHDWMMEKAQQMFSAMGSDFGDFFAMMKERGLLDLQSRDAKAGGGYCTLFTEEDAPFIFANFAGTQGDVRVFTHECGHAFQCFRSQKLPLRQMIWPTYEACEIHSMSLEFLTYPWMKEFFGEDADRFIRSHLESAILFIPYGVAVDEFQHLVYAHPTATPEERCAMWKRMEEKYLPHRRYSNQEFFSKGHFWQRQSHIYQRPFYYIDYCLAQTCALQFWALAEKDQVDAMRTYRYLCELGGSKSFTGLLQAIDLPSPFEYGSLQLAVDVPSQKLFADF